MAELADALASGASDREVVRVQVSSGPPLIGNTMDIEKVGRRIVIASIYIAILVAIGLWIEAFSSFIKHVGGR